RLRGYARWRGYADHFVGPDMDKALEVLKESPLRHGGALRYLMDEGRRPARSGAGEASVGATSVLPQLQESRRAPTTRSPFSFPHRKGLGVGAVVIPPVGMFPPDATAWSTATP